MKSGQRCGQRRWELRCFQASSVIVEVETDGSGDVGGAEEGAKVAIPHHQN